MHTVNSAAKQYILDYFKRPAPGFAVQLSAPWGAGKTYFMNEMLANLSEQPKPGHTKAEQPLVVSIFGAESRRDIEGRILQAAHPILFGTLAKTIGRILRGQSAYGVKFGVDQFLIADTLLDRLPQILVFDDVDRTLMDPRKILGAINGFVEKNGKHVVIMCDDRKLWEDDNSRKEKEKVIGASVPLVADIDAAIPKILETVKNESANSFFSGKAVEISDIFMSAGHQNLRSLKQAIWDYERVYLAFSDDARDHAEAMDEAFATFLALSLEYKAAKITRDDLKKRDAIVIKDEDRCAPLRDAATKFKNPGIETSSASIFSGDAAVQLIADSYISGEALKKTLMRTDWFQADIPVSWGVILAAWNKPSEQILAAAEDLRASIANREFVDIQSILGAFMGYCRMHELGLEAGTLENIVAFFESYIADLEKENLLVGKTIGNRTGLEDGIISSNGLNFGFPEKSSPWSAEFSRLCKFLIEAQSRATIGKFAEYQSEIDAAWSDPSKLAKLLAHMNGFRGKYSDLPVMSTADAKAFAQKTVDLPGNVRSEVLQVVNMRYYSNPSVRDNEKDWLKNFVDHLETISSANDTITKWQVARGISKLQPYIK